MNNNDVYYLKYTGGGLSLPSLGLLLIPGGYYEADNKTYTFLKNNYRYVIARVKEPQGIAFKKISINSAPMRARPLTDNEEIDQAEEIAKKAARETEEKAKAALIEKEKAAIAKQENEKKPGAKNQGKKRNVEKL